MGFLFAMVVVQRHRILAQWWVHQLRQTTDAKEQAYYVACLAGIGDDAAGAIAKLGQEPQGSLRALIIPASQGLSGRRRFELLRQRLNDRDFDIRLSTATALAFLDYDFTHSFLISQMNSPAPEIVTAAAAGLARVDSADAVQTLCETLSAHLNSWVRAQAIESLGQQLFSKPALALTPDSPGNEEACDPVAALVRALFDQDQFFRRLALETEIAQVSRSVTASKGLPVEPAASQPRNRRAVADIAAATLSDLTGHSIAPQTRMSVEEERRLVQQCKTWLSERGALPAKDVASH
jgi:HEAT repeat protein